MLHDMSTATTRRPIRSGLFFDPLDDLSEVRLAGSRCQKCGETHLGELDLCPNCGSNVLTGLPLSRTGTLWTYTIVRHRPPGNYKGPEPFQTLQVGLVELPEGIRVLAPLEVREDSIKIGMALVLCVQRAYGDDEQDVIAFNFRSEVA